MAKALNQTRVSEVLGIDYLIIQGLSAVFGRRDLPPLYLISEDLGHSARTV
jgi:hypothetical protein